MPPSSCFSSLFTLMVTVVLISIPVTPPVAATGQIQPKQEIRDRIDQFAEAWNNNDANELAAMFTTNGTFVSPDGDQATSRKEIQWLLTQENQDIFQGTTLYTDVWSIHFLDEGEATVSGHYTLEGYEAMGFLSMSPEGTFTFNFVEQDGEWMIQRAKITR